MRRKWFTATASNASNKDAVCPPYRLSCVQRANEVYNRLPVPDVSPGSSQFRGLIRPYSVFRATITTRQILIDAYAKGMRFRPGVGFLSKAHQRKLICDITLSVPSVGVVARQSG
jgi:hypothetical protein